MRGRAAEANPQRPPSKYLPPFFSTCQRSPAAARRAWLRCAAAFHAAVLGRQGFGFFFPFLNSCFVEISEYSDSHHDLVLPTFAIKQISSRQLALVISFWGFLPFGGWQLAYRGAAPPPSELELEITA